METALTISLSCNLLADSMHLFLLPDVLSKFVGQMLRSMLEEARRHFDDKLNTEAWSHSGGSRYSDMAVVIEGHSLHVALETANRLTFLRLCQLCRTVIFCRVTPVQKVQVCSLLRCPLFVPVLLFKNTCLACVSKATIINRLSFHPHATSLDSYTKLFN